MSVLLKLILFRQPQYHCTLQFCFVCTDSICLILAVKALPIKASITTYQQMTNAIKLAKIISAILAPETINIKQDFTQTSCQEKQVNKEQK